MNDEIAPHRSVIFTKPFKNIFIEQKLFPYKDSLVISGLLIMLNITLMCLQNACVCQRWEVSSD